MKILQYWTARSNYENGAIGFIHLEDWAVEHRICAGLIFPFNGCTSVPRIFWKDECRAIFQNPRLSVWAGSNEKSKLVEQALFEEKAHSYRSQAGTLVDGVVALALPLLALALRLLALALWAAARVPPDSDHLVLLMLDRGAGTPWFRLKWRVQRFKYS